MAQAKEWGGGEEEKNETFFLSLPLFHFLALVSFLARPKPRILFLASFLGLFLLRNQTETLATQAIKSINKKTKNKQKKNVQRRRIWPPRHRDSNLHYNRLLREKPTPRPRLLKSPLLIPRISQEKKSYHLSNFALLIIYDSCFVSFLTLYTSR